MNEEKKWPLYKVTYKYIDTNRKLDWDEYNDKYPKHVEGLPRWKFWNITSNFFLSREELSQGALDLKAYKNWLKFLKQKKLKNSSIRLFSIEAKFVEFESWCIRWFNHYTIDVGQTDEEVLSSFRSFVERKRRLGEEKYCLMGAEDTWRWSGEDGMPAPCRCDGCKKSGLIFINH